MEDHTSNISFLFHHFSFCFSRTLDISPAAEKLAQDGDFQLTGYVVDAQKEQTRAPRLVSRNYVFARFANVSLKQTPQVVGCGEQN